MPAALQIPVDEYLRTHYDPDRDYVDGEAKERNVGEWDHSTVQTNLAVYLAARRGEFRIRVKVELRLQIRHDRYRIPDVCVLDEHAPVERVVTTAPLLCVEVLSASDTVDEMQERVAEYLAIGVPCVWVISPKLRRAWIHEIERPAAGSTSREIREGLLTTPDGRIQVPLQELFTD